MTYIYGLICPIDGNLKYVGKSNNCERRLRDHMTDFRGCEYEKSLWIRTLKVKKLKPELFIIQECHIDEWKREEEFWIGYFKSLGINLLNKHSGGNGLSVADYSSFKPGNTLYKKRIYGTRSRKRI